MTAIPHYDLFRQDDNGREYHVARFQSENEATAKMQELAKGGHKQFYEIRRVLPDSESRSLSL